MLRNKKNEFPPQCDFQISLTINCVLTWPSLKYSDNLIEQSVIQIPVEPSLRSILTLSNVAFT